MTMEDSLPSEPKERVEGWWVDISEAERVGGWWVGVS